MKTVILSALLAVGSSSAGQYGRASGGSSMVLGGWDNKAQTSFTPWLGGGFGNTDWRAGALFEDQ